MSDPVSSKPSAFGPSLSRLVGRLRPHRIAVILVVMLGVVSVGLTVVGPWLLGQATNLIFAGAVGGTLAPGSTKTEVVEGLRASGDDAQADFISGIDLVPGKGVDFHALAAVLAWVLGLYVLASAFAWLQARILNSVVQKTVFTLRQDVERKLHAVPLGYFDRSPRGDLLSRVTNDVDNVAQSLQQTLSQVLTAILTVIGVLGMMFWTSPLLAVISLVALPLTVVVVTQIAKRSQRSFTEQWARTGTVNARVEENFTGHALIKVFGQQRAALAGFRAENRELYRATFRAQFLSGLIMPAMMFVGNLVYVVIAVVGGLQVAAGSLSIGAVQAFIQYSRQFTQPLAQLGSMVTVLQSGLASAERVFTLLDEPEQTPDPVAPRTPAVSNGRLTFEDVSFSYDATTPLIDNVSFSVEPGQTVAIVGPTGAGKTTLVNLIMRFYELTGGRITLDGVDIARMTRDDLRSRTGMVLQDTWLFGGTILENIAYGRPDASDEEILEAARATFVDRFVRSLPEGYDTILDGEASGVSSGEKQLITIARAFVARPDILILDEATSSVDTRTERHVQHAMSTLRSGRTSFVIAHRLSTIRDADVILVMDAGKIVEIGDHDELVSAAGPYARLYNRQIDSADEEA